ncbi:diguanylate cyclase [Oceanospirillum sanctuarii]|uniref:diguanylate cyclase n=1 Tax=Oceanospirillum sanctuarii TaxID=1434821 RepID=UPI000A3BB668|nr:diguanylate cyclase [Oceanospirillum sanctuarii]
MKKNYRLSPLNLIWLTLLCLAVVGFSLWFNLRSLEQATLQMVNIKGQTVFHLIQTTRLWNARHGGVYVPITDETPANPLLEVDERDIVTPKGIALTMVNPAYMTRQIGELLKGSDVEIHLTSLKPLNENNAADTWERAALIAFENESAKVKYGLVNDHYRYMEPLVAEKPCLECHRKQGYREGDIRGGLSLSFPRADIDGLVSGMKENVKKAHVGLFFSLWILGYLVNLVFLRLKSNLHSAAVKEQQLSNLAMTDDLTGILNRRSLMQAYEQAVSLAERRDWPLAVLMLDIDHFKKINDKHGHLMGDEVLVRFARSVSATLRDSDVMGRYGGEEFLIFMQDEDSHGAFSAAERIRKAVGDMRFEGAAPFSIHVSIGVAERTQLGCASAEELIKAADEALYQAKNNGRNQTCLAEAS